MAKKTLAGAITKTASELIKKNKSASNSSSTTTAGTTVQEPTYDSFYKNSFENLEDGVSQQIEANNTATDEYIDQTKGIYADAAKQLTKNADISKGQLNQQYQKDYDMNAVSQLVAERQLKEKMANSGMTDSGYNRTQQTALAVNKMNADRAVTQQKTAAGNAIQQTLDSNLAANSSELQSIINSTLKDTKEKNAALRQGLTEAANQTALTLYNNYLNNKTSKDIADGNNATSVKIAGMNNASSEKIAQGNNDTSVKVAGMNNTSDETIAAGNNATSIQVAGMNNASSEKIAQGNNDTSVKVADMNNTSDETIAAGNNATSKEVASINNSTQGTSDNNSGGTDLLKIVTNLAASMVENGEAKTTEEAISKVLKILNNF